jgi:hypothetical protein
MIYRIFLLAVVVFSTVVTVLQLLMLDERIFSEETRDHKQHDRDRLILLLAIIAFMTATIKLLEELDY